MIFTTKTHSHMTHMVSRAIFVAIAMIYRMCEIGFSLVEAEAISPSSI